MTLFLPGLSVCIAQRTLLAGSAVCLLSCSPQKEREESAAGSRSRCCCNEAQCKKGDQCDKQTLLHQLDGRHGC